MPRGGFYAISSSRIKFGCDGCWYSDGERVANRRIADLFSRHICRHPKGGYQLVIGDERVQIEVEDTPYVVTSVVANPDHGFSVVLNDGDHEPLDLRSLRTDENHVLSCAVKRGRERARFLRSAYYQIASFIEEERGRFYLRCADTRHPITRS